MIRLKWFNFGGRRAGASSTEATESAAAVDPNAKSVLIVDDDAVFVRATSMQLQAAGFQVSAANGTAEALQNIRDNAPDAVLMDIEFEPDVCNGGMGTWDGFQLMNWMRSFPNARKSRFIMVSNSDTPQHRTRAAKLGAVDYLAKPVQREQLCAAING